VITCEAGCGGGGMHGRRTQSEPLVGRVTVGVAATTASTATTASSASFVNNSSV
jgi:hypothetical protein